jgi:hypothetical protein
MMAAAVGPFHSAGIPARTGVVYLAVHVLSPLSTANAAPVVLSPA